MISSNFANNPQSKYFLDPQPSAPSSPDRGLYNAAMAQTPPSNNTSPTDHHSHLAVRQMRNPRKPLYVPAALRPTDPPMTRATNIPARPRAPDTPPSSNENSFDSGKMQHLTGIDTMQEPVMSNSPATPLNFDELRRNLSRVGSDCLEFDSFPDVRGPPTQAHWKPNESASECALCRESFSFWFRRHHCRSCGNVVCANDSRRTIPLDENARYNGNGGLYRACDVCATEWETVKQLREARPLSADQAGGAGLAGGLTIPARPSLADPSMAGSMARSQGVMEWSTF